MLHEPIKNNIKLPSSGNAQRSLNTGQLFGADHGRMCSVSDIDLARAGLEVAADVAAAKTVVNAADALDAELVAHLANNVFDDGLDMLGQMVLEPVHDLEALGPIQRDGVSLEQVGHDDEVAMLGELVGQKLGVDELVADHVGEDQDGMLRQLVAGVREVCRNCVLNYRQLERSWT